MFGKEYYSGIITKDLYWSLNETNNFELTDKVL